MKKLIAFLIFILLNNTNLLFPLASDNVLRSFAEANLRQMCQVVVNEKTDITIHLDHKKLSQTLLVEEKNEKSSTKDHAEKK